MARKSNNSPFNWLIGLLILFAVLAEALKHIWPFLLFAAVVYGLYRWYKSSNASKPAPSRTQHVQNVGYRQMLREEVSSSDFSVRPRGDTAATGYTIPPPPRELTADAKWIPRGESVTIGDFRIDGGMIYVGANLPTEYGRPDPALIDPRKPIAKTGDFTERHTNYWPSYSEITPQARHAYLQWLADGKKHLEADVGYVFLYFYGLERRILIDIAQKKGDDSELPEIVAELQRLLGIYGEKSGSFKNYCGHFLELLALTEHAAKLYEKEVPELPQSYELPYYLRLALGQAAVDKAPIPAHIAFAWVKHDPAISRKTAFYRCMEEFRRLFDIKYKELYGDGIVIAPNKTKLKLTYRPASAGFNGEVNLRFGDTPDVTALTAPVKKLQAIVDACTEALDPYSRFLGRNPDKAHSLESLLQLPISIWPHAARSALDNLNIRIGDGMIVMAFKDLAGTFNSSGDLNKDKMQALARALESEKIGIEPDILGGAKTMKPDEKIVLFHSDNAVAESRVTPAYQAAVVTLELASAVAHADGEFSAGELRHLNTHIDAWVHLTPAHQRRLKARARLLMDSPVSIASMKKKVEPLGLPDREAIASFAAMMVQMDGIASPEEIKLLEKVYKLLGFERDKVYSDVHAAASSPPTVAAVEKVLEKKGTTGGFTLDQAKIAALQQDSERVSALLVDIFTEESEPEAAEPPPADEQETNNSVLGLDGAHSAFARMLLSRPSWQRDELSDVAQDLEIMLDGALERLNEAALDNFDIPFAEGDDPVEITPEIVEKLAQ